MAKISCTWGRNGLAFAPGAAVLAGAEHVDTDFCIETLEDALQRFGAPGICNPNQGAQFTFERSAWTPRAPGGTMCLPSDSGAASVNHEEVYLRAYGSMAEARTRIGDYFKFYNSERKHQSLGSTPDQAYFGETKLPEAA